MIWKPVGWECPYCGPVKLVYSDRTEAKMMDGKPDLRPCPFCGSDGLRYKLLDISKEKVMMAVRCMQCLTCGPGECGKDREEADAKAAEAWNRRAEPENGGCKIWDALECARFDKSLFPASDLAQIEADGKVKYWHICKGFETDNQDLMNAYRALFGEGEENATD